MLARFPFIEVRAPVDVSRVGQLAEVLVRGESEAIVLAEGLRCSAFRMDEAAGLVVKQDSGLRAFEIK